MNKIIKTYVALGSNLDDPIRQIQQAIRAFANIPQTQLLKTSRLFRNPPLPSIEQPDFINAVAELETTLNAHDFLLALQQIEQQHNKKPIVHWGPRTLDLDLLLYGDQCINTPGLTIPHPELTKRNFVLYPLAEIAPDLQLPNGKFLRDLLTTCSNAELEVVF